MEIADLPFRSKETFSECLFDGCPDLPRARGLCYGHLAHLRMFGELRPKRAQIPRTPQKCNFSSCDRVMAANGWCRSHYVQARRHGQPMHPVGSRPKKHRTVGAGGYVKIWAPDHPNAQKSGWVLEHIAVMSASLGRPLWPDENVHHKNGDRADNRLTNLELWSHSQPKGQRIEDKVAWALELLNRYQPDVLAK